MILTLIKRGVANPDPEITKKVKKIQTKVKSPEFSKFDLRGVARIYSQNS